MSRTAWIYIYTVLIAGCVLVASAWPTTAVTSWDWLALLVLTALVVPTQFFDAVNGRHSYFLHTVFFFSGAILLPTPLFVLVVIIPHTVEWLHKRLTDSPLLRHWYIQPFNIATHVIAGIVTHWLYTSLGGASNEFSFQSSILAPTVAVFGYVLVNHLLVGQVLVLARGMSWRDSGTLEVSSLLTDVVMMFVGFGIAALWNLSPWLMLPGVAPLVLIYRALTVPELQREAQTDEKTGLWNARHFGRLFTSELEKATDLARPLALVMADLDLLRNINNTYGHLAGDAVLAGVAKVIRDNIRDTDFAGRFGGEEFAVVLPGVGELEARSTADRLRRAVEEARFVVASSPVPIGVTMSLGIAIFPHHAASTKDLIHEADVALYQSKLSGRNTVRSAGDVPHAVKLEFENPSGAAVPSQYAAAFMSQVPTLETESATGSATESDRPNVPPTASVNAKDLGTKAATVDAASKSYEGFATSTRPIDWPELSPSPNWFSAIEDGLKNTFPRSISRTIVRTPRPPLSTRLLIFISAVILVGVGITMTRSFPLTALDLTALGALALLTAAAELLQVQIYGENTVSVSMAVAFATAIVLGIPGVAVVSAVIVLVHNFRADPPIHRTVFNWAVHVLASTMPVLLIRDLGIPVGLDNLPLLSVLAALAAFFYYVIETGLVAAAMSLTTNKGSIIDKWREQFQWLAKHYLVLGLLGLFLAIAYAEMGAMGLLVFVLPIFMMHLTQKEYVRGTENSMTELRRMNEELAVANQEVTNGNLAIQRLNDQLFLVLAKIIDARDPYVSGHATQVADYAVAIAREMRLPEEQVEQVRQAGLLHDIGKIGISDAILNKPSRLTDIEYENIKSHVTLGADFLETCNGLQGLAPFIRHHHEWWDGSGYPSKLAGTTIPMEARILAVCDAVEAMASDRPYQKAMPAAGIIPELHRCANTQFDPAIVEAFTTIVSRRGLDFIVNTAETVTKNRTGIRAPVVTVRR
ncbi:MAG: diguanylate cyclase [Caldilineaceae bacterium]|nr:diguanylate cyclase [Caldilineaceae bacterium]MBP8107050.1 diguanylate cyclase [Caldilineaceae bacterium]MBP8121088.1 diguanylate cyclase [Caldilineaceae bacterium]MBP9070795.1 diguanylate cyclase [Caldilineaceae bacterium]